MIAIWSKVPLRQVGEDFDRDFELGGDLLRRPCRCPSPRSRRAAAFSAATGPARSCRRWSVDGRFEAFRFDLQRQLVLQPAEGGETDRFGAVDGDQFGLRRFLGCRSRAFAAAAFRGRGRAAFGRGGRGGIVAAAAGDEQDHDDDRRDRGEDPAAEQPGLAAGGKGDRAAAGGGLEGGRRSGAGVGARPVWSRRSAGESRRVGGALGAVGSASIGSAAARSAARAPAAPASAAGFAPPGIGGGMSGAGLPSACSWASAPTTFARTSSSLSPRRAAISPYPCSPEASRRSIAFCSSLSATRGTLLGCAAMASEDSIKGAAE